MLLSSFRRGKWRGKNDQSIIRTYGDLNIMPTGGVNINNIKDYLAIPNVVACGGSWFVEKSLINGQKWNEIGQLVQEAVSLVQK